MSTKKRNGKPESKVRFASVIGLTVPIRDAEIAVIQTVLTALKPLDYKARKRVIEYGQSWCVNSARKPGSPE